MSIFTENLKSDASESFEMSDPNKPHPTVNTPLEAEFITCIPNLNIKEEIGNDEEISNICNDNKFETPFVKIEPKLELADEESVKEQLKSIILDKNFIKIDDNLEDKSWNLDIASNFNKNDEVLPEKCLNQEQINKKLFRCAHCDFKTVHKYSIQNHMKKHDRRDATHYQCDQCSYKTIHKSNLAQHIKKHNMSTNCKEICKICSKSFVQKQQLYNHYVTRHRNESNIWKNIVTCKIFECPKCCYQAANLYKYKNHLLTHGEVINSKQYQCDICSYKTNQKSNLKIHSRIHEESHQSKEVCIICQQPFNQRGHLVNHYISKHKDDIDTWEKTITHKIHKCTKCSYICIGLTLFRNHLQTHEDKQENKNYQCNTCDYKTHTICNLKMHLNKIYECDQCHYRSTRKYHLKVHMRTHTGTQPFLCGMCDHKFNSKQKLDGHIVTWHSEMEEMMSIVTSKIYLCRNCSYRTVNSANIKRHLIYAHMHRFII